MDARFRIRTREGNELEPRTLEIFQDLVRSGVIRPDDLVYDALTGEWGPARTHPMVQLFQDPLVVDPLARSLDARPHADEAEEEATEAPADARPPLSVGGFALDLVEARPPSPEEEAKAFVARMEEERRADPDRFALDLEAALAPTGGPTVVGGIVGSDPQPRPGLGSGGASPVPASPPPPPPPDLPRRRWTPARGWSGQRGMAAVGLLALLGVAVVVQAGGNAGEGAGMARAEAAPPRPSRGLSASEGEVRQAAYQAFLEEVERLRRGRALRDVPAAWLEGRYLAGAVDHPEVREYWEEALAFGEAVRAGEGELYRTAYLSVLEGLEVQGPVRSLRLAAALEDFLADAGERQAAYDGMEELARAALDLHAALVELDGRVSYEPIRGRKVSADPVLEAAGTDEGAQALLEASLDRVLRALHGPGGTRLGDRSGASTWLVTQLAHGGGPGG